MVETAWWMYTLSGAGVGFIVGITGVGGGSLMTPLLVWLLHIDPKVAVGTDLLYAAITKFGGACIHSKHGHIERSLVKTLLLGSLPGSLITIAFLKFHGPALQHAQNIISTSLGIALLLTALSLLVRERLHRWALAHKEHVEPRPIIIIGLGFVLGVLVTLSSVGAGALGVTVLYTLYPSLPIVRIIGSDIAHAVPLTLVAGLGHAALGHLNWTVLGALLLGSLPGITVGSRLSAKLPEVFLRTTLALILTIIGLTFLKKGGHL